jgi:hypothetical protein
MPSVAFVLVLAFAQFTTPARGVPSAPSARAAAGGPQRGPSAVTAPLAPANSPSHPSAQAGPAAGGPSVDLLPEMTVEALPKAPAAHVPARRPASAQPLRRAAPRLAETGPSTSGAADESAAEETDNASASAEADDKPAAAPVAAPKSVARGGIAPSAKVSSDDRNGAGDGERESSE